MDRRAFLRRAAAAGIALPSMAAILAACGSGAQDTVATGSAAASGSAAANQYGTGGIAGAPYPLARPDAPVTWTVQSDNPVIDSGMAPEKNATLKVMRWPYYIDPGLLKSFAKKYDCTIEQTQFTDMDKGLAKIQAGGDFDIMFGMNVWALGRSIAAGLIRPINHDYIPNFSNLYGSFHEPVLRRGCPVLPAVLHLVHGDLLAQRQARPSTRRPWTTRTTSSSTTRRRTRPTCWPTRRTSWRCRCSATASPT